MRPNQESKPQVQETSGAEKQPAHLAPPVMPPELARESLADAIVATLGLLDLLAANLANAETAATLLESPGSRTLTVALIRQTQYQLNEALNDVEA